MVKKDIFCLFTFLNFWRIDAKSKRFSLVDVKIEFRLHEHFASLMFKTYKVPLFGLNLPKINAVGSDLRFRIFRT